MRWSDCSGNIRGLESEDGEECTEFFLEVWYAGHHAWARRRHFNDDLADLPLLYAVCLKNMINQIEHELERQMKQLDRIDAYAAMFSAYAQHKNGSW